MIAREHFDRRRYAATKETTLSKLTRREALENRD